MCMVASDDIAHTAEMRRIPNRGFQHEIYLPFVCTPRVYI